ncbi:Speckle-type POZ protein [Pseudolycoriella hygida]|uniref:Speckle-type POZ protein n=1 Tax=Pseudolycoriella hygida TaxID=35572 RepID=A0A9Q0S4Y8_9DIPT|nr:Speckle-type POZ protein [Pseudolycoriella hygida]
MLPYEGRWNYVRTHKHTMTMEVDGFSRWFLSNRTIKSPPFLLGDIEMYVQIFKTTDHYRPDLNVSLLLSPNSVLSTDVDFKLSIIDSNGDTKNVIKKVLYEHNQRQIQFCLGDPCSRDIGCINLIYNNRLNLQCDIQLFDLLNPNDEFEAKLKVPKSTFLDDFNNILNTGDFTDVTVTCKGQRFNAHKAILAARSPVFAAMFRSEMKEVESGLIDITDMEADILMEMLQYIYTDEMNALDEIAIDLLVAADKYGIERLRIMCEQSLASNISVENAADTLIIADTHSAVQLKKQAVQFIKTYKSKVIKTTGWKQLTVNHVNLIVEMFEEMSD